MTLIVCRKTETDFLIQSDSQITDEFGNSLERVLSQRSPLTGLLKTVILHPHICLSFAGQSIFATDFLKGFLAEDLSAWNTPRLIESLYETHMTSNQACEFILCECVERKPQITLIKEGRLELDLPHAWIGSHEGFAAYQAAFHTTEEGDTRNRMRYLDREGVSGGLHCRYFASGR